MSVWALITAIDLFALITVTLLASIVAVALPLLRRLRPADDEASMPERRRASAT
jgi:hypothetical protein